MADYPNPNPLPEERREDDQPFELPIQRDTFPSDGRKEDAVRVYDRQEENGRIGPSLIYILIGLVLLILLGYLAYMFLL